jgi:hypothetical protein
MLSAQLPDAHPIFKLPQPAAQGACSPCYHPLVPRHELEMLMKTSRVIFVHTAPRIMISRRVQHIPAGRNTSSPGGRACVVRWFNLVPRATWISCKCCVLRLVYYLVLSAIKGSSGKVEKIACGGDLVERGHLNQLYLEPVRGGINRGWNKGWGRRSSWSRVGKMKRRQQYVFRQSLLTMMRKCHKGKMRASYMWYICCIVHVHIFLAAGLDIVSLNLNQGCEHPSWYKV